MFAMLQNIAERCNIRSALLDAVETLPMRDEYEIIQAVGAIVEATWEPGEVLYHVTIS